MTQSPQQPDLPDPLPAELVLGIARDLQDVADRIAEMKALCDRQMADLADAAAAAAGITEVLARRRQPAEPDPDFTALGSELSQLYKTVEAQVGTCQRISKQFLGIARDVGVEIAALRAAATASPGGGPSSAAVENGVVENGAVENGAVENVVWLKARRDAQDGAAAQTAAKDLRLALRALQDAVGALFRAQAESRAMVASLRERMRDHRRRTRDAGA